MEDKEEAQRASESMEGNREAERVVESLEEAESPVEIVEGKEDTDRVLPVDLSPPSPNTIQLLLDKNKDYQSLLAFRAVLTRQLAQVDEDIGILNTFLNDALESPEEFLESLSLPERSTFVLPDRQVVPCPPLINFCEYSDLIRDEKSALTVRDKFMDAGVVASVVPPSVHDGSSVQSLPLVPLRLRRQETPAPPPVKEPEEIIEYVRGRPKTVDKPQSFNLPWNDEEQAKLEELLAKYPDQPVAAHRWSLIADELGTRSAKQVASRVQKFFIRLSKADLSVPGRRPNMQYYTKGRTARPKGKRKNIIGRLSKKRKRAVPQPERVPDEGDAVERMSSEDEQDVELKRLRQELHESGKQSHEFEELMRLKRIEKEKQRLREGRAAIVGTEAIHVGYLCDGCGVEPIVGMRWQCLQCPDEESLDLCDRCHEKGVETDKHKRDHKFRAVLQAETKPDDGQESSFTTPLRHFSSTDVAPDGSDAHG